MSGADWVGVVASTTAVTWVTVWLVRRHALRLGLIDQPNHRSSHKQPTPGAGGIGIVLGVGAGLLAASALGRALPAGALAVFAAASVVAIVGLIDDFRRLPPGLRLLVQTAAAAAVVTVNGAFETLPLPGPLDVHLPSVVLGWLFSLLWITAITNFFNFMDGIDGLAGGQAVASCCGVLLAGWSANASLLAACTAMASFGFLLHNWSPARVFMGDVGSGFLGFLLASLPFLAPIDRRGDAAVAVGIGLALFLLDPLETLFRRAMARKPLTSSHREHVYQQFLEPGAAAGGVAGVLVALGVGLAVVGALAFRRPSVAWAAIVVAIFMYLGERRMANKRVRGSPLQAPAGGTGFDRE